MIDSDGKYIPDTYSEKQRKFNDLRTDGRASEIISKSRETATKISQSTIRKSEIEQLIEKEMGNLNEDGVKEVKAILNNRSYTQNVRIERLKTVLNNPRLKRSKDMPRSATLETKVDGKEKRVDYSIRPLRWPHYNPGRTTLLNYNDGDTIVTSAKFWGWLFSSHRISYSTAHMIAIDLPEKQNKIGKYILHMLNDTEKFEFKIRKKTESGEVEETEFNIEGYNLLKAVLDFCFTQAPKLFGDSEHKIPGYVDYKGRVHPNDAFSTTHELLKNYFRIVSNDDYIPKIISTIDLVVQKKPELKGHRDAIVNGIKDIFGDGKKDSEGLRIPSGIEEKLLGIPYAYYRMKVGRKKIISSYIEGWKARTDRFELPDFESIKKSCINKIKVLLADKAKKDDEVFPKREIAQYCQSGTDILEQCTVKSLERLSEDSGINMKASTDDNNMVKFRYAALHSFRRFFYTMLRGYEVKFKHDESDPKDKNKTNIKANANKMAKQEDDNERVPLFDEKAFKHELDAFDEIYNALGKSYLSQKSLNKKMLDDEFYVKSDIDLEMISKSSFNMYSIGCKLYDAIQSHRRAISIMGSDDDEGRKAKNSRKIPMLCNDSQGIKLITMHDKQLDFDMEVVGKHLLDMTSANPIRGKSVEEGIVYITGFCLGYAYTLGYRGIVDCETEAAKITAQINDLESKLSRFPAELIEEARNTPLTHLSPAVLSKINK